MVGLPTKIGFPTSWLVWLTPRAGSSPVYLALDRPSVQNRTTFLMFTVYAIKSLNHKFIYVGMTENLDERLKRHNNGYNKSTKLYAPFELIYSEQVKTGEEARVREKYLKSTSGKRFLHSILGKRIEAESACLPIVGNGYHGVG